MDINKLYENLGYTDIYSGSILFVVLITILFFIATSYFIIFANIGPIKDDWTNQRCNPKVMPFAGFINKPDEETIFEFTKNNFISCTQNILISITSEALKPITFITSTLQELFDEFFVLKNI